MSLFYAIGEQQRLDEVKAKLAKATSDEEKAQVIVCYDSIQR